MTKFQRMLVKMDCDDLDITMDALTAAQSKLHRAHPEERKFWNEIMDLLNDMNVAWREAFLRKQVAKGRAA